MINWCAYCQEYQGEIAPFDTFTLSHGMCARCREVGLDISEEKFQSIQRLKDLQDRFWAAGKSEDLRAIDGLIQDAIQHLVRPVDVLVGLLAPLLYQIGEDWACGKISVADEHRFTAFAIDVIGTIRSKMRMEAPVEKAEKLRVLLINAEGNIHSLGIQVLEMFVRSSGIPVKAIYPGLPVAEVIQLAQQLEPEWIGISVSLADQIPSVTETVNKLIKCLPAMANKILLGGNAIRKDLVPAIPGAIQIVALGEMLTRLRQI